MAGGFGSSLPVPFLPICLKNSPFSLNSTIAKIGHVHIVSAVKCHIKGISQLSRTITIATKARGEGQIRTKNLHSVVELVGHIYSLGLWVDFDSNRIVKLQLTTTFCPENF